MSIKRMIHSVETHSGEPMRVITGGVPHVPGDTVYEQMRWLRTQRRPAPPAACCASPAATRRCAAT